VSTAPRIQFGDYVQQQPEFQSRSVQQSQLWLIQPGVKKPPSGVKVQSLTWQPEPKNLTLLDDTYIIEDRAIVLRFINENRLLQVLLDAKAPLNANFGRESLKTLTLISDDEGFDTLFCVIAISGNIQQGRQALRTFDREWWVQRVSDVVGRLNFDFSII